jgi:hypothetical protein
MKEITRRSLLKPRIDTSAGTPLVSGALDAAAVEGTSRRAFIQGGAGAAAGAAMILGTPKVVTALEGAGAGSSVPEPKGVVTDPSGTAPREPVTAFVRDADRGEVTVMFGKQETTYRDPVLVKRLLDAAP